MNQIVEKQRLSQEVYRMSFHAPHIASERKAGQFLIIQLDTEIGERVPLTIADADPAAGSATIVFQTVGETTHRLAALNVGDAIANVLGPLGRPTHIEKFGKVLCVGGGIGVAPLHPIAKAMKDAGNEVSVIIGARAKELIIMEEEMRRVTNAVSIVTDDGSYGRKALVTQPLKEACESESPPDLVVVIGPPIMMKFCAETTRPFKVPTVVSLNTIMIDGTGMCGGCRVSIGGKTKFVCVDGPEFDGHLVDFDNMMLRLGAYRSHEKEAHHKCHISLGIPGEVK
ncbi:MAG: sulfide/dihydroorotate dehydrogenase-like FAD/NAD-binding protein [Spirochaetales bacterium]